MVDVLEIQCPHCRNFVRPAPTSYAGAMPCPRCGRNISSHEPSDGYERSNTAAGLVLGGCLVSLVLFGAVVVGVGAWLFLRVSPRQAPPPVAVAPQFVPPEAMTPAPGDSGSFPPGISENDGARPAEPVAAPSPPTPPPNTPNPSAPPIVGTPTAPNPTAPAPASPTEGVPGPAPVSPPSQSRTAPQPKLLPRLGAAPTYDWKPQDKHFYQVTISAKLDELLRETRGSLLLSTASVDPTASLDGTPFPRQEKATAVGTAFFVTSQGHLVTCAHVLRGAVEVRVRYGGQMRAAQIVAQEHELDLALLRLDVTDAAPLDLSDSDAVQLAQEVRAVGYPLTDVLGESVKVTRGSVAGLLDQDDRRMLQIDAAINAGNSGGPIVDEQARVVGVATAKLAGEDVSNVGFAVPANALQRWLVAQGVTLPAATDRARLDGPELAKQVTPSVVLVNVELGPGGGEGRQFILSFNGHVTEDERAAPREAGGAPPFGVPRPPRFPGIMGHMTPRMDQGRLRVDESGEVEESQVQVHLPYLLGPLALAPFEPLPPPGTNKWRIRRALTLSITEQDAGPFGMPGLRPRGGFGGFGGPRGLPPFPVPGAPFDPTDPFGRRRADADRAVAIPALETVHLEVLAADERELRVKKTSELKSVGKDAAAPSVHLTLTGEFVVDRKRGVVARSNYTGKFIEKANGVERTIPITWTCTRSDPAPAPNVAPVPAPAPGAPEVAGAPDANPPVKPVPPPGPAPLTDEVINQLLDDVRIEDDKNGIKRALAMAKLGGAEPLDARRDEVFRVALPLVKDSSPGTRSNALRICARWAGKEHVPELVNLLDEVEPRERFQVYLALGSTKVADERLAKKLVEKLQVADERSLAYQALRSQGAVAEDHLLEALQRADLEQQTEFFITILLGEFGGEKSLAALKKSVEGKENDPKSFRRNNTIRTIERRLQAAKPK